MLYFIFPHKWLASFMVTLATVENIQDLSYHLVIYINKLFYV